MGVQFKICQLRMLSTFCHMEYMFSAEAKWDGMELLCMHMQIEAGLTMPEKIRNVCFHSEYIISDVINI
jgi:hypothetical protein